MSSLVKMMYWHLNHLVSVLLTCIKSLLAVSETSVVFYTRIKPMPLMDIFEHLNREIKEKDAIVHRTVGGLIWHLIGLWANTWYKHQSLRCMATATPDLHLPFFGASPQFCYSQIILLGDRCTCDLTKGILDSAAGEIWTYDLSVCYYMRATLDHLHDPALEFWQFLETT